METYILIALSLVAVTQGSPVPNDTITKNKDQDLSGFFIPADSWNSFQNQLQPKTNQPPISTPSSNNQEQNVIKLPNQSLNTNPSDTTVNVQVNGKDNNAPKTNSPLVLTPQPNTNNQPIILQSGQAVNQGTQQGQFVLIPSDTVQGNQPQSGKPIILVQQPSQNNPTVVPQQPSQPLYLQPGQSFVLQNGQGEKPTQVLVAVPSNNQGGYTNGQPSANQGTVYTLVLNGQSPNTNQNGNLYPSQNGNMYLVPVQSGSSSPIILRPAK
ncbi:uncharacterized protein LOC119189121 [Manduca sexta]|uniref:uncharacterized protein LOC119189121 n=1 Tax=Manduca sexta TaxID=7130 RepID=UPI00188F3713|nr:uncharacterized protein LOC119189121 [Manduca sexta]